MRQHALEMFFETYNTMPFPFLNHCKKLIYKVILIKTVFKKALVRVEIARECFDKIPAFLYEDITIQINMGRVGISFMKKACAYLFKDFFFR